MTNQNNFSLPGLVVSFGGAAIQLSSSYMFRPKYRALQPIRLHPESRTNEEMTINNENRSVVTKRDPPTGMDPVGAGFVAVRGEPAERRMGECAGPIPERAYRSEEFCGRVNVEGGSSFDGHGPAYHFGASARDRYPGRDFDDVESEISSEWVASRGPSILSWEWAKHAARDAWNRISPSSGVCA